VFVNARTATAAAATTVAVPWASTTAGDWCLLTVALSGLSTITDPSGWTASDTLDESTTLRFKSWWHRCDGSESGSLSVSWTGAANAAAAMTAYRYIDATTPVYGHNIAGAVSTATSRASSQLASMAATAMDVHVFADVQTTAVQTWTAPASCFTRAAVSAAGTPFVSVYVVDAGVSTPSSTQLYVARTAVSGQSGTAFVANHVAAKITASSAAEANNYATAGWLPAVPVPVFSVPPISGQIWPRGNR
jgi:hypothetical protein